MFFLACDIAKAAMSPSSLHRLVKDSTGQNVYQCRNCQVCDVSAADMDIPLSSIVQMIITDDEEVLSTRTLWSDEVLDKSRYACKKGLDLHAILGELRKIAIDRQEI